MIYKIDKTEEVYTYQVSADNYIGVLHLKNLLEASRVISSYIKERVLEKPDCLDRYAEDIIDNIHIIRRNFPISTMQITKFILVDLITNEVDKYKDNRKYRDIHISGKNIYVGEDGTITLPGLGRKFKYKLSRRVTSKEHYESNEQFDKCLIRFDNEQNKWIFKMIKYRRVQPNDEGEVSNNE